MSETMYEISVKCKTCGAVITANVDKQLTGDELKSLEGRDCGICYLKSLLERDLQMLDHAS
jgi:hypothetical protein